MLIQRNLSRNGVRRSSGKGSKDFRLPQCEKEAKRSSDHLSWWKGYVHLLTNRLWQEFLRCYVANSIYILLKRDSSKECERSMVIVVSPLLALMGDQVSSFSSKGLEAVGITKDYRG